MAKEKISLPELISSRFASIIFGIIIITIGGIYLKFADQITVVLPFLLRTRVYFTYGVGLAYIAGGVVIIGNKPVARTACYGIAILLFCMTVAIDLRGVFNFINDPKIYLYSLLDLFRDFGLVVCAIIIGNFPREDKHKRRRYYYKSSSERNANQ